MISLIAAHDLNRVIGLNGDMPWGHSIKSDLHWFKQHTLDKTILMGSKTFKSIGQPLPHRKNIVLTRNEQKADYFYYQFCNVVDSIGESLKLISIDEELMVIGGSNVYEQFLPLADRLYITHIDAEFEGDTFFPEYDLSNYDVISEENTFDEYQLRFVIYQKK